MIIYGVVCFCDNIWGLLYQEKYNAACVERDEIKVRYTMLQSEVEGLHEAAERKVASNQIEVYYKGVYRVI